MPLHRFAHRFATLVIVSSLGAFGYAASGDSPSERLPIGASQLAPEQFADVPPNHWASQAVATLTELGILVGYPDGSFGGTRTVTRYEIAVIGARLIDYQEGLIGILSGDSAFVENLRQTAADLRDVQTIGERVARLELALAQAASLEYARSLERRLVALEAALNDLFGEERFPGRMTTEEDGLPLTAADAVPELGPATTPANANEPATAETTPDGLVPLRLRTENPHPLYLGISPGIVSTSGQVYLGVQFGYDGIVGPVGAIVRLNFNSGDSELRLSLSGTVRFTALLESLELYCGLGLGASFRPEGTAFLIEAPFGLEHFVTPQVGLFLQLTPSYAFSPIGSVDANLTAGVNLRF